MEYKFACVFFLTIYIDMSVVLACKSSVPLETYSMQKTLMSADIVVYGNYTSDFLGEPKGESYPHSSKHVVFEVFCIFKSDGLKITSNITLNGNYMWHSCFHTRMDPGRVIILALENPLKSQQPEGFYKVYEPNVASVGGFEATQENLQNAVDFCGLQSPVVPEKSSSEKCNFTSKTNVTLENCVNCGSYLTKVSFIYVILLCVGVMSSDFVLYM